MTAYWIKLVFSNFSLVMFDLAVLMIIINRLIVGQRVLPAEIIISWLMLFGVGFTGIFTFVMHAFFPAMTAANIGWRPSIFQAEVAMANLAFGVLGILSFKASYPFRLATVIGVTLWLWGDAVIHLQQIITQQNYSRGNAGSWLWMDVLIPLILIICIKKIRENKY